MATTKEMLEQLCKNMDALNHNSTAQRDFSESMTATAKAIADNTAVMSQTISTGFAVQQAEHKSLLDQMKQSWKLTASLIAVIGGAITLILKLVIA